MKLDKTEIFNLLSAIAAVILMGGDALPFEIPEGIPEWGVPILFAVILVINFYSRSQVKGEADLANTRIDAHLKATEISRPHSGSLGEDKGPDVSK